MNDFLTGHGGHLDKLRLIYQRLPAQIAPTSTRRNHCAQPSAKSRFSNLYVFEDLLPFCCAWVLARLRRPHGKIRSVGMHNLPNFLSRLFFGW